MSEPFGNVFRHCPNSDGSFVEPEVPDPLESDFVFVNASEAYPEIGQGEASKIVRIAIVQMQSFKKKF